MGSDKKEPTRRLFPKQKLFCQEYIVDLNSAQAAIRAGYSKKTAKEMGCENLTKPHIAEEIQRLMDKRSERVEITADDVLRELAYIGLGRIDSVLEVKTEPKVIMVQNGEEIEEKVINVQSVKMKDTDELDNSALAMIGSIKETKDGIEYKMNDKIKALELLGKNLKLFTDRVESVNTNHNLEHDVSQMSEEELNEIIEKAKK